MSTAVRVQEKTRNGLLERDVKTWCQREGTWLLILIQVGMYWRDKRRNARLDGV